MKKFIYITFCTLLLLAFCSFINLPVLNGLSTQYEFSISNGGSSSNIVRVLKGELSPLTKLYGESCTLEKGTSVKELFNKFNASLLFSEKTEKGISYYGYSPTIRYFQVVNGQKVNLHVYQSCEYVKVGVPIIFGGY